jgi:hypothetical protein
MDSGRDAEPRSRAADEPRRSSTIGAPRGRTAGIDKNLVAACKHCGRQIREIDEITTASVCSQCGQPLHSCRQCRSFDSSARWECSENARIPARVPEKTAPNSCPVFSPSASFDLTGPKASDSPADARKAFDALFKK